MRGSWSACGSGRRFSAHPDAFGAQSNAFNSCIFTEVQLSGRARGASISYAPLNEGAVMPGNLPHLQATNDKVVIQQTTFTIDVLGRYICSLWREALHSGGAPFDAVVIGAGMYGAYCAQRLYRRGKRVLLLEAGSFLV